jgi:hypothetical protein
MVRHRIQRAATDAGLELPLALMEAMVQEGITDT